MSKYVMPVGAKIDADLDWLDATGMRQSELEGMTSMSVEDLIAYAEAVPSWDYVDEGMWDYIAYWLDLPEDGDDFDPESFLAEAKAALKNQA